MTIVKCILLTSLYIITSFFVFQTMRFNQLNLYLSLAIAIAYYFTLLRLVYFFEKKKFKVSRLNRESNKFLFLGILGVFGLILVGISLSLCTFYNIDRNELLRKIECALLPAELIHTVLIGPLFEEIFFRDIIAKNLKTKYGVKKAIFISSLLFAVSHITNGDSSYLFQFIGGILFGYIYFKSGCNWLITSIMHSLYNAIMLIYAYNYLYLEELGFASNTNLLLVIALVGIGIFLSPFLFLRHRKIEKLL